MSGGKLSLTEEELLLGPRGDPLSSSMSAEEEKQEAGMEEKPTPTPCPKKEEEEPQTVPSRDEVQELKQGITRLEALLSAVNVPRQTTSHDDPGGNNSTTFPPV